MSKTRDNTYNAATCTANFYFNKRKRIKVVQEFSKGDHASVCIPKLNRTAPDFPRMTCGESMVTKWMSQRMWQIKTDDGYRMFINGHVESVETRRVVGENEFVYVRSKIKPEQRQSAQRYTTWMLCVDSEEIKPDGCD